MLFLFDIDGTLVAGATDAHRDALHAALREVHGVDATKAALARRARGTDRWGDRAGAPALRRRLGGADR